MVSPTRLELARDGVKDRLLDSLHSAIWNSRQESNLLDTRLEGAGLIRSSHCCMVGPGAIEAPFLRLKGGILPLELRTQTWWGARESNSALSIKSALLRRQSLHPTLVDVAGVEPADCHL